MSNHVIIGMPAFNEEKYVGNLVRQCKQYTDDVLVVNDGSTDRTSVEATLAGAKVYSHESNRGYGGAIQSIFNNVRGTPFDVLIILDSDNQHDSSDVPKLVDAVIDGNDVVIGHRNSDQIPKYRFFGIKVLSEFTQILSGASVDSQSGFRAYSPKAVNVLHPKENGMAISSEIINLATQKGLKIAEVPISVRYLKDSSTQNPVTHGVGTLTRLFVMISERKPLLFFGSSGILITIAGVIFGIRAYDMMNQSGILPVGTALVSLLLMVNGSASMFTGIMLNVIRKIRE